MTDLIIPNLFNLQYWVEETFPRSHSKASSSVPSDLLSYAKAIGLDHVLNLPKPGKLQPLSPSRCPRFITLTSSLQPLLVVASDVQQIPATVGEYQYPSFYLLQYAADSFLHLKLHLHARTSLESGYLYCCCSIFILGIVYPNVIQKKKFMGARTF